MKIAVTAKGTTLDSAMDPRFGRAAGFLIYDDATDQATYMNNDQNLNLAQGAGIQAAMTVANAGVQAVISGHVGPKAYAALNKGGIKIFLCTDGTVANALEQFKQGGLSATDGANVEGHW